MPLWGEPVLRRIFCYKTYGPTGRVGSFRFFQEYKTLLKELLDDPKEHCFKSDGSKLLIHSSERFNKPNLTFLTKQPATRVQTFVLSKSLKKQNDENN